MAVSIQGISILGFSLQELFTIIVVNLQLIESTSHNTSFNACIIGSGSGILTIEKFHSVIIFFVSRSLFV